MQDALQDLQNEFGEIAASFAVSSGPEFPLLSAIKVLGLLHGMQHHAPLKLCQSSLPCSQAETEAFKAISHDDLR